MADSKQIICPHCKKPISGEAEVYQGEVYHKKCMKIISMALIGYEFICPICDGEGTKVETYNSYPSGLPDSGFVYQEGHRTVDCDFCDGMGFLEKEPKQKKVWTKE